MAFLNVDSTLVINNKNDIYNFRLTIDGIELIIHEKSSGNTKQSIIEGEILEFDVSISDKDEINLICRRKDNSLWIYSLLNDKWIETEIPKEEDLNICGVKILLVKEVKHIFYYMESLDNKNILKIYHQYIEEGKVSTFVVKETYKSEIIKPIEVIKNEDKITIGYYNLGEKSEDIFLSQFNIRNKEWERPINVTSNGSGKLYLDILELNGYFHLTYSEYEDENFIINYKKITINSNELEEISKGVLSNQANCTYPTLIYQKNTLWNVWTEYESVVSSYSQDEGNSWSNPYVWNESKREDFSRCRFITNRKELNKNYKMNYSFNKTYPKLSFLGFGDLKETVELVKKKEEVKVEEDINKETTKEISTEEVKIVEKKKKIHNNNEIYKIISDLEKRVYDLESHIYRRRSPFAIKMQQKKDS